LPIIELKRRYNEATAKQDGYDSTTSISKMSANDKLIFKGFNKRITNTTVNQEQLNKCRCTKKIDTNDTKILRTITHKITATIKNPQNAINSLATQLAAARGSN
jgi:hypothetical protein